MIILDWRPAYAVAGGQSRPSGGGVRWPAVLLAALCSFAISLAVRCLEIPAWNHPEFRLGDEYLLATHDAYHWIAGAEGFEFGAGHPMSEFIRILSLVSGALPANVGFWLPLVMGSALALAVFAWAAVFGSPCAGIVAGVLAACAPGYLARTMLGYCDTDFMILLFAVLLGLVPAAWLRPWLSSPLCWLREWWRFAGMARAALEGTTLGTWPKNLAGFCRADRRARVAAVPSAARLTLLRALSAPWLLAVMVAGVLGYGTQAWHSYFPYAIRFCAALTLLLAAVLGPRGGRGHLLAAALCYCVPLLAGWVGLVFALPLSFVLLFRRARHSLGTRAAQPWLLTAAFWQRVAPPLSRREKTLERAGELLFASPWPLTALWTAVGVLLLDASVWQALLRSTASYLKVSGDASHSGLAKDPLVFPSVAQSIIEVQNLTFMDFLDYCHPVALLSLLGLLGYGLLLLTQPGTAYLLVLLAVALSSLKLGGRMAMFGSPAIALGFCMAATQALRAFCALGRKAQGPALLVDRFFSFERFFIWRRFACCVSLSVLLSVPIMQLILEMSKGSIISREQAEALIFLRNNSPEDAVVWNWWDWGYATHHFARRHTVSDGARHGGPSLFVPAAVYTTADPHFARQLMAYTSEKGGEPGDIFEGLSGSGAAALMADLDSGKLAPKPKSKQYIITGFELVPLGFWISTYGNWDFVRKEGKGYFISSIPQSLQYNLETGLVLVRGHQPANAASIDLFGPTKRERQFYFRTGNELHFIFNLVTGEKYSVKSDFYGMMLYQLLVAEPKDSRIRPYFKPVFDNSLVRVYEMLDPSEQ